MRDNDSHPPAGDAFDNNLEKDSNSNLSLEDEGSDGQVDCENDKHETQEPWDGSEAEIVIDDQAEAYEEETTGVKIVYKLRPEEIRNFISRSADFEKNRRAQKKHTVVQVIVFIAMLVLGFLTTSKYYMFLALFPLIAILLIWALPYVSVKKLALNILGSSGFSAEFFPDKIEVTSAGKVREIPLDGSCESEEFEDLILIFEKGSLSLIVPMRAVEPEFKADIQAMILAGTKPKYAG